LEHLPITEKEIERHIVEVVAWCVGWRGAYYPEAAVTVEGETVP
jgi:hypothetical protein